MKQIKNIGVLLIAVALTTTAFGQKIKTEEVPTAVKQSLAKKYPTAKKVTWEKEAPNYEANFDMDKKEYSALLNAKGTVLETEVEIPNTDVPASILQYVKTKYPGQKIMESAMITKGSIIKYEVEIKGTDLIFDKNGKLLETIKLKSKKEEKEDGDKD